VIRLAKAQWEQVQSLGLVDADDLHREQLAKLEAECGDLFRVLDGVRS
jgi:hypothetical protein